MDQVQLRIQTRGIANKGANRRLRREGELPGIIYGRGSEPQPVTVSMHDLEKVLHGGRHTNTIFNLQMASGGEEIQALLRDVQRHPVHMRLVHADFQRVDLTQAIHVEVPIHQTGSDPVGVRNGGILEHPKRTIAVRCLPLNIPRMIEADISNLDVNQSFHVSELTLPEGVEVQDDPEAPLFTILPPKLAEEPTPGTEEAAGPAEPEVVGRKAAEEEKED